MHGKRGRSVGKIGCQTPIRDIPFSCHLKSHKKFEKNISLDQYVICHFTNMQIQIQLIQVETKITNLTMKKTFNSRLNLLFFSTCIS